MAMKEKSKKIRPPDSTDAKLTLIQEWDGKTRFDPSAWGRDHFSTLLYVESVYVDHGGRPDMQKMRTEPGRIRRGWDKGHIDSDSNGKRYATRLVDGTEVFGHDDWDCVDDMVAAGMVEWKGTGMQPILRLTDYGWKVAHALRRYRAETRQLRDGGIQAEHIKPFVVPAP